MSEEINDALEYGKVKIGLAALKPEQHEAIKNFVLGKDVFACLLTRYGKSVS